MGLNHSNTAVATELDGAITDVATTLDVNSATGYPDPPFPIRIGAEAIVVGAKSGLTFSSLDRGYDGTANVAHSDDDPVTHVAIAEDLATPGYVTRLATPPAGDVSIDEFKGTSLDAAWTEVTIAGGQTIAVQDDLLVVTPTSAIALADTNCILVADTLSAGEAVEISIAGYIIDDAAALLLGPLITAGTGSGAAMAWHGWAPFAAGAAAFSYPSGGSGTLTTNGISAGNGMNREGGTIYLRIEFDAANSWKTSFAIAKGHWHAMDTISRTMTHTHLGLGWNTNALNPNGRTSFAVDYIRKVTV